MLYSIISSIYIVYQNIKERNRKYIFIKYYLLI